MNKHMVMFVRHAESEKNIIDVTGGEGKKLTEKGIYQVERFFAEVQPKIKDYPIEIISSDIIQVKQTAELFANKIKLKYDITDKLKPAGVGIIDGLTKPQLEEEYPYLSEQLKLWRNKEIEAIELNIPEMESPIDFWKRMISYLKCLSPDKLSIIFCTRSIMVFAYNVAHGHLPYKGGGYKHTDISNCEYITFSINNGMDNIEINKELTSERLL